MHVTLEFMENLFPRQTRLVENCKNCNKKNHSFRWSAFSSWWANLSSLVLRIPARGLTEANTPISWNRLVWLVERKHYWPIFLFNGDTYRIILINFFVSTLHGNIAWFQQDGATCHTSHATINLRSKTFDGHLINQNDDVSWLPRSCDLISFVNLCEAPLRKTVMT